MKNYKEQKSAVISGLFWKFLERGGTQGVMLIVSIVLARVLTPKAYGIIALTTIFINISNVFIQNGFNASLIQKKDADDIDFSTVFYITIFVAMFLYILIYIFSPLVAEFYNEPQLQNILKVLSIILILGAVSSVQTAIVSRNMMFRKLFLSSLVSVIVSGAIGIALAYCGFGVWALVAQQVSAQLITIIVLFTTIKWRPRMLFSLNRAKSLFSFGSKILASTLLDKIYNEVRGLIIGKMYSASMLGYYNRGQTFPQQIIVGVDGTIQSVMFPALSAHQDDIPTIKSMVRRSIKTSTFTVFPLMIGMAVLAHPIISIVLTDKWLPSVPYLQIFCFSFALWPIHTANLQAIKALGRSDIFFRLAMIKKVIGFIVLGITIPFGVFYMALGVLITGLIGAFINSYPNKSLLDYSFIDQAKDIFPAFLLSCFMGLIVYLVGYIRMSTGILLTVQVLSGIVVYIGTAKILKMEPLEYLLDSIKEILTDIKKR